MKFEETREAVVRTCIALADQGYLAGTGGNVALRADADHFAVTPSATDYYAMSAADVCVVRLSDVEQVDGERTAARRSPPGATRMLGERTHASARRERVHAACQTARGERPPPSSASRSPRSVRRVRPVWHLHLGRPRRSRGEARHPRVLDAQPRCRLRRQRRGGSNASGRCARVRVCGLLRVARIETVCRAR